MKISDEMGFILDTMENIEDAQKAERLEAECLTLVEFRKLIALIEKETGYEDPTSR